VTPANTIPTATKMLAAPNAEGAGNQMEQKK